MKVASHLEFLYGMDVTQFISIIVLYCEHMLCCVKLMLKTYAPLGTYQIFIGVEIVPSEVNVLYILVDSH